MFKKLKLTFIVTIAILFISCGAPSVYVSTTGNDDNPGTRTEPVATIQKAVELNRKLNFDLIRVEPGEYFNVSVKLAPRDSGLKITSATNEFPELYGGLLVPEWKQNGKWIEADIPGELLPTMDFRILIVNDTLRNRARLPAEGAFFHLSEWPYEWQSTQGGWSKKPTRQELTSLYYNPDDLGSWLDVNNAELTVFHAWDDSYVTLKNIDTVNNSVHFTYPATHPAGAYASWAGEKTRQYIVWNIKEGMSRPGQWYLDRSNRKIVYWPEPYENVNNIIAMVPVQNFLIEIADGTTGIALENLAFDCSGRQVRALERESFLGKLG